MESLERRLCLSAPSPFPNTPFSLPTDPHWRQTPYVASPIFADLNGNGRDELITVASGGRLLAFSSDAQGQIRLFRAYETGVPTKNIKGTPIVVPHPDGRTILVAALGRDEARPGDLEDDRVFAWDAATAQVVPGWPVSSGISEGVERGVMGPLASGDLTGDGVPEIVVGAFSAFVTAFRLDGSVLWRYRTDDSIIAGAVIGDIDRDGVPEVIIASPISPSPFYQAGGFLNILTNTGAPKFRIPVVNETLDGSPVLADLTGDGFLEIVVGTGFHFARDHNRPGAREAGNRLYAYNHRGELLPGWPYVTTTSTQVDRQTYAAPAVADLTGDGRLEVVVSDFGGYLHVVQANGRALPGWEGGKLISAGLPPQPENFAPPIIADVNGDGRPDIIASHGAMLRAFDITGNVLFSYITPGNPPDGHPSAPAVGQFDGRGGLELATVTHASHPPNPPSRVNIFRLPPSSLTPPWPMHRRSANGVAVMRSQPNVNAFVNRAFQGVLERMPTASEREYFRTILMTNRLDLFQVARLLAGSPESRGRIVTDLYQRYLGRAPDANGLASWSNLLRSRPWKDVAIGIINAPEFRNRGGNTHEGIIRLMYQVILERTPQDREVQAWLARIEAGLPLDEVATVFFHAPETVRRWVLPVYQRAFGPHVSIPKDAFEAILFDYRRGRRELETAADIVASNGNYAATHPIARWIRTVYRDLLDREASPSDVAMWLRAIGGGQTDMFGMTQALLNSPEARGVYINQRFQALLGRPADPATRHALIPYVRREDIDILLTNTDEYFARHGGTVEGFIQAVYRDLADIAPAPSNDLASWSQQLRSGVPRAALPANLVLTPMYRNKRVIEDLFRYLPDETMGVLRTGNQPPHAPGQPINPNPHLIHFFAGAWAAGMNSHQIVGTMLVAPQYVRDSAYFKGFYRRPGNRS